MNDNADRTNLEARLSRWMKVAAPPAAPSLAERLLQLTAASRQRRGQTARFALPAFAATAAVAAAVAVGLLVGQVMPATDGPLGTGASPTASPFPTSSATPTPPASPSPIPSVTAPFRCENDVEGYAVQVPADWFANPAIDAPAGGDDIPACRYFAPAPFDVQPNSGLPNTIAIGFKLETEIPPVVGTELSSRETSVAGHPALVREIEMDDGGFSQPGTRLYSYYITLEDGTFLWVSTDSSRVGDYDEHRAVIDQMMATLEISR